MQVSCPNFEWDVKGKKPIDVLVTIESKKNKAEITAWRKPEDGRHKLNVDASFIKAESKGAWGAILRDSNGKVLLSGWDTIPRCQNADTAEAIADLEGIKAILAVNDKPVIV
jgi:hypothetical protein